MSGGAERTVVDCVPPLGYFVSPQGLFAPECRLAAGPGVAGVPLRWIDLASGRTQVIATLQVSTWALGGLAVSPDGRTVLYARVTSGADLMMIENFR